MDLSRLKSEFPAPSYRGYQEEALESIRSSFEEGNDIVLVQAPTGSGKSLLARAVAGCAREVGEVTGAYYTTPQVSQLDDVADDDLLEKFQIVRGKGNYHCIHPDYDDYPVPQAPCERFSDFDCGHIHECPYFKHREEAQSSQIAAMTLAYFLEHSPPQGSFDARDVVIVDEAHGLLDWAEMYGAIELNSQTVPNWSNHLPPAFNSLAEVADWANQILGTLQHQLEQLERANRLDVDEADEVTKLRRITRSLSWFLEEFHDSEATGTRWLFDQEGGRGSPVTIRPVDPERVLYHSLWKRAENHLLLSATLLNKSAFCRSVGVSPDRVGFVRLQHTFPLKHRPLFDVMCGKMTYEERDETLPKIAKTIVQVMQRHRDQKGLVHCHSYAIQSRLEELLSDLGVGDRIWSHTKSNRDRQLAQWKQSSKPTAFLSVKMEEALDLEGDLARWQVLCKAPYPNTNDPRVEQRLEDDRWMWYYRQALATVIQACGRVVRAPDDWGATYLADSSFEDLFNRARTEMPPWFEEQVDNMLDPDLPAVTASTPNP